MKELYWEDKNIIFFDNHGWWLKQNKKRECLIHDPSKIELNYFINQDYASVIEELRKWAPTWYRWNGRADNLEILHREAAIKCLILSSYLKKFDISKCIMHTGIIHHIDTLIFDIACKINNIDRIYLYCDNITGRLIPYLQKNQTYDRKILNYKVSGFNAKKSISDFKLRSSNNLPPLTGGIIVKGDVKSISVAVLIVMYRIIKIIIKKVYFYFLNKKVKKNNYVLDDDNYFLRDLYLMFVQKKALNYLNSLLSRSPDFFKQTSHTSPKILILAHFQPEASSFPEGWDFANHIDIVIKLRSLGYKDNIYYKEHIASSYFFLERNFTRVGIDRTKKYYETLESLGCIFIKDKKNTKYGGPSCKEFIPVTITGTIALERSLNGLRTIFAGYPWWEGMPGAIKLSDLKKINGINNEFLIPCEHLAKKAFKFLNSILSYKTITNSPGIGLAGEPEDKKFWKVFKYEFDNLRSNLQLNK